MTNDRGSVSRTGGAAAANSNISAERARVPVLVAGVAANTASTCVGMRLVEGTIECGTSPSLRDGVWDNKVNIDRRASICATVRDAVALTGADAMITLTATGADCYTRQNSRGGSAHRW